MRSPLSSLDTACTREPRMPMQAPMGSVRAIVRQHRDLGAVARVAGAAHDLDQALADFRHFELEQLDHEFRRGARDEQLRAADLRAHLVQVAAQAVAGAHRLARNRLVARNEGLGIAAQVEVDVAALDALDDAGDQLADAILVGLDHLRALGFAHALHDDLLGGLRGDAAELGVLDLFLDVFADLGVGALVDRVHQADLPVRRLHLDVVGDDFPAAEGLVFAGLAIDGHADVRVLVRIALLGRRGQRRFHRLENDVARDALLVGDRIHHQQQFFAHFRHSANATMASVCLNKVSVSCPWPCRPATSARARIPAPASPEPAVHFPRRRARTANAADAIDVDHDAFGAASTIRPRRRRRLSIGAFSTTLACVADELREMLRGEQRPVDARRGHFQHIMPRNRILDIQRRGNLAAGRFAIVDADLAIGGIDVDAQGALPARGDPLHPEAGQSEIGDDPVKALGQRLRVQIDRISMIQKQKMGVTPISIALPLVPTSAVAHPCAPNKKASRGGFLVESLW